MRTRYIVTAPEPHGNAWWRVADTESTIMPNFGVADFAESMPNAEAEARGLCDRLNCDQPNQEEKKQP